MRAAQHAWRLEIEEEEDLHGYVEDFRALLSSASITEQKACLRSFVKGIEVSNSEVTVSYSLPLTLHNTEKESIGVLAFVQNGGPFWTRTRDLSLIRTAL